MVPLLLVVELATAAPRFGAGLVIGDPNGVTVGWRGNAWNGAQAAVGIDNDGRLDLHADYLQTVELLDGRRVQVPLYVGLGAGVGTRGGGLFGASPATVARVPIGASLLLDRAPLELFAQVVPTVRVLPDTRFGVDFGVGGRYYF